MAIINCYDVNGDAIRFLTQWDHDISIRATGVKTSPIPEFRFSNKNSQKSKCISGVVVGDGVKTTIPNGFLQEALPIYVQLFYTYPSGDAKTEHTFVIPVKPASMPDGAVYEPVEVRSIVELEKRVKALEENGVPGAGGVPSDPSFDTVSLGGDSGVVITPEGTADAPAITFYGAHGNEPVALNNVADATDDRSAPNLGQVKQLVEEHSGQGGSGGGSWGALDGKPVYMEGEQEKFDPAWLPDGGFGWIETGEAVVEWDGSTDGLDVVAVGSDMALVRVSGLLPSFEAMIGRTVETADGTTYEISAETAAQSGPLWVVYGPAGDDLLPVLYGVGVTEYDSITFPATGLYAVLYQDQPYRFAKVTIAHETIHGLDAKYLPEEAVREYVIELDYSKTVVTSSGKGVLVGKIPNDLSAADINHAYASGQRLVVRLKTGDDGVTYMRLVGCGIRNWSFEVDMGSQYTADRIQKLYLELYQSEVGSDAMTARVAYVHTVLGGDTEQVQADWVQNDPTQPDYVKNRTHWEENNQTVIEWDGSTDYSDNDSFEHGGSTKVKISDIVPSVSELETALIAVTIGGNDQTMSVKDAYGDSDNWWIEQDTLISFGNVIWVVYDTNVGGEFTGTTISSTGVYFDMSAKTAGIEHAALTYGSTVVQPLADKWIPDSIARKTDIPALDDTLTRSGQAADAKAVGDALDRLSGQNVAQMEPADGDIPKVFLTGSEYGKMTTAKNEVGMGLAYISKTDRFSAAIKIKFQGSSSLFFSKKNYTIKMYTDDSYESKLKKSFRDWGHSSNKYVLKANFIDHSHARNIISARLWDEIVASRPDYDSLPAEMRNSPRNGAIDGFPVKLYVNGTYQGVYTWNIGKDDWMWGMDEDNPNQALLCGESHGEQSSSCFRSLWNGVDENDWAVEVGTNSTALKNSLNALIQFVMDNNGADFKAGIGNYLDIQSAIDYYILHYEICAYDCMARNMLLATFDGTKWICGAYDLDSTYGLTISGGIGIASNYACPEDYKSKYSLLWERLEANYADELKARQSELRKTVLSYSNMVTHFERFMDAIGSELYAEDLTIYTDIPSGSTNNIKQIRNFIRDRQTYVDAEFAKMENFVPVYCTGISLSATELTFTGAGTQTLVATVTPDGCTDSVIWESDDTSIATVRGGVVTAKANGSVTITARCGAYTATCAVSISGVAEPVLCTGISLDKTSLIFTASGTQALTATVTPSDCTEEVTWESSDDGVATVVGGVVTAVSDGDAAITARCGGYSAVCNVTVAIASNRDIITLTETTTELPMTPGKLDDKSGEVVESQDCYITNSYIAVAENQSYTVAGTSGQYLRVYGYDAAFKFNRGTHVIVGGSDVARTATFTIPSGVKYIRCQMYHDPGTMTITINK